MTGQTISHYRILDKLGEGGMGVVYKAEDTKLRRTVALKFLSKEIAGDHELRARFVQEAQAAAALNHPNICTIHEIDEEHGFLAMEFIEGQNVAEKAGSRPLPLEEALAIAIQAAQGLEAAHEKGIVHRDIKSANLMVTAKGQVKVMDFGLAQLIERSRITRSGMRIGTPAYMSPEQMQGQATDRRTDVWGLGVVLYEMVSGRLPFARETEAAVAHAIVSGKPEPLTALRTGLPVALDRIVSKALAKDPADRYQHASDLVVDLRGVAGEAPTAKGRRTWLIAACLLAFLAAAGLLTWRFARKPETDTIRSLAILPLKSLQRGGEDYLEMGLADTLITKVSQIHGLTVRPTSAVRGYASKQMDALQAARELQVEAVLDGSLQRSGDRLRVSVNLLRVRDGTSLWAETFDTRFTDIFAVQDEVSRQVVSRLRLKLSPEEKQRLAKRGTSNPEAYQLYLTGLDIFNRRTALVMHEATIPMFERAVAADPGYALAHARLAHARVWKALFIDVGNASLLEQGKQALMKAESLDPNLSETHEVRFEMLWSIHGGFRIREAILELRRAVELNPNAGYGSLAALYSHMGLEQQALAGMEKAIAIDPLSQLVRSRMVEGNALLGRFDESIALASRFQNFQGVSWALVAKGRLEEAQRQINSDLAANPKAPHALGPQAILLAMQGRFREAEAIGVKMEGLGKDRSYHHATYALACVYALESKPVEAVKWLQKTVEYGMPNYLLFTRDPNLGRIRSSPEFVRFMAELRPQWEGYMREFQ
ncbi:MAG: protein kinase [Acidobacteriia bacterium]|nr:protein kinase [Terriglobia bacterium]